MVVPPALDEDIIASRLTEPRCRFFKGRAALFTQRLLVQIVPLQSSRNELRDP